MSKETTKTNGTANGHAASGNGTKAIPEGIRLREEQERRETFNNSTSKFLERLEIHLDRKKGTMITSSLVNVELPDVKNTLEILRKGWVEGKPTIVIPTIAGLELLVQSEGMGVNSEASRTHQSADSSSEVH